jgi:adenylylsulfate kinase-like enzyme
VAKGFTGWLTGLSGAGKTTIAGQLEATLRARALRGEVPQFSGVSDPYEEPPDPDVTVETDRETTEESVAKITAELEQLGYLNSTSATAAVSSRPSAQARTHTAQARTHTTAARGPSRP